MSAIIGIQQRPRSIVGQQFAGQLSFSANPLPDHITLTDMGCPSFPTSLLPQQPSPNSFHSWISMGLPRQVSQDTKRRTTAGIPGKTAESSLGSSALSHNGMDFSHLLIGNSMQSDYSSNPALDLSEFPSLRGSLESSSAPNLLPSDAARWPPNVGMVKQPMSGANEFQIHREDFPALPGSQRRIPRIPGSMVTDQFGMVGLLAFIQAAETDQNLVSLALGRDLTILGLDLNSPENLYPSFGGPWSDHACRPHDIDYNVPSEYLINQNIKDKLAPIKLNCYDEDLLFFLFYMYSGETMQVAAAAELYQRNWRFHKDERMWIKETPGMFPTEKMSTFERGTYYFFDPVNWRKVIKEFNLDYDRLEERPTLPHYQPTQPTME